MPIWLTRTLIGLLIALTLIIITCITRQSFHQKTNKHTDKITQQDMEISMVRNNDLEHLPALIKDWLYAVGVVDSPVINHVQLHQSGKMKLDPEDDWLVPTAKQTINVPETAYVWDVKLPKFYTLGRDVFHEGRAEMRIHALGLIPVVNEKNHTKLNESALHRFLLEMVWYPSFALSENLTWEPLNDTQVNVTLSKFDMHVSAIFTFEDGLLRKVEAMRYKDVDDDSERLLCVGTIDAYEKHDQWLIPTQLDVTWMMDDTAFTWYKIDVTDITFN